MNDAQREEQRRLFEVWADERGILAHARGARWAGWLAALEQRSSAEPVCMDVEQAICNAYPVACVNLGEVEDRAIEQRGFRKGFAAMAARIKELEAEVARQA